VTSHKAAFAKEHQDMTSLEEICADLKPTVAIGAAAIPGAFTEQFIELMGEFNQQPIIFALSNPTSKAECTAEQAYKLTQVRPSINVVSCRCPACLDEQFLYSPACVADSRFVYSAN